MSRRKKKGEPEMLIVSFCDIVTITTAAMFFALLITVQEAVKIPVFRPTPRAVPSNKQAEFFECRNKEVFFIDKSDLDSQVEKLLSTLTPNVRTGDIKGFLKAIQAQEVGNEYYTVNPNYLLTAIVALEARTGVKGESEMKLADPQGKFQKALLKLNKNDKYLAFIVRDDSFQAFRLARKIADKYGFDVGWELLGEGEPIKFGAGGSAISVQ